MSLPLDFSVPRYVQALELAESLTLRELCRLAGVKCRASGEWTLRPVEAVLAGEAFIEAEPGGWGRVRVGVPARHAKTPKARARYALGALAFGLFDGVARESIRGESWTRLEILGRPKAKRAMTVAERQRKLRLSRAAAVNDTAGAAPSE